MDDEILLVKYLTSVIFVLFYMCHLKIKAGKHRHLTHFILSLVPENPLIGFLFLFN